MSELEILDLDIPLLSNDELGQYDDLAGIERENIIDTFWDDLDLIGFGRDENALELFITGKDDDDKAINNNTIDPGDNVNDLAKVNFPVSLLVRGKVVPCIKSLILESEYLSNMAEAFENSESLPVPEIVSVKDIREITKFVQFIKSPNPIMYMNDKLSTMDLEHKMHLLIICDLLGFIKIKPYMMSCIKNSVMSDNWKLVYSKCSRIMGLSSIVDHLLEFLLHHTVTQKDDGSFKDWTGLVSVQFMERILKQTKYEISEEVKFEFVMDWGCSVSEEDFLSLLSMIHFKCFSQVKEIKQAVSDMAQLGVLSSENLSEIIRKLEEAITFKLTRWKLVDVDNNGEEYVLLLKKTKSEVPWPKLLGFASHFSINESNELLVLNQSCGSFLVDDNDIYCTMTMLICGESQRPNIFYRSSIFYIHYPNTNQPQLCQFNFDFKKCFHVLDLPLAIRSINDQHRRRRNDVFICNVKNYLYLFSKDAFSKQNFDSVEKMKVFRIDLDLAIESCNEFLATKNALLLKWEHFSDIPEAYLEANDNSFDYDIKAVDVGEDIFIVSNDLCISLNITNKVWSEKELAPPARNNPIVFGSDSELFVIGGTCMGQALVSGQKYKTETWKMDLLPSIPDQVFPLQNLRGSKGLHFKNFLYLYSNYSRSERADILIFDLFLNQWSHKPCPDSNLYCLDKPIWL